MIAPPNSWFKDHPDYPAQCREFASVLNALDKPFDEMAYRRATGAERSDAPVATGLVPKENNSDELGKFGPLRPYRAGAIQIDGHAKRVKRLRTSVEHGMRLSEFAVSRSGGFRFRRLFVTLTLRPDVEWHNRMIAGYLDAARKWATRREFKLRYQWVAECQGRGVIHYHVCFWIPRIHRLPTPDRSKWWKHGMSNVKTITNGLAGVLGYMSKYMSKSSEDAMKFPVGARLHGAAGLDREQRREIRYRLSPYWVRDAFGTFADIRRTVGGWVDKLTGRFIRSPWKVTVDASGLTWAYRAV